MTGMTLLRMSPTVFSQVIAPGQVEYTVAGTYSWVVPAGVTTVCAVLPLGGGAGALTGSNSQNGGGAGGGWSTGYGATAAQYEVGAVGAARIIWGTGRAFPSTNTGNL